MTWKKFTVYIDPDKITIHFPEDPQPCLVGGQVLGMLTSKGFVRLGVKDFMYQRDRTDFWVEQCKKLAQKFGANVAEAPNITPEPDPITELQKQILAMQQEMTKLRAEVEELKKSEPSDD
ncbi:hypothetical protein [Allocoleopsis sp.]|uniref:hypothetical protein n=1 Tax=Allocoleopsis sp. TaxID=3088169 RepID=UPI002FD317EC